MMIRRFLIGLCLFALLGTSADALTGTRRVLLSGNSFAWVKPGASIDISFATGQYFSCTLATCFSLTRASPKTDLLPSSPSGFAYQSVSNNTMMIDSKGLLIEESRTNQLINSAAPATQTTGSLGTGTYTLWVNGAGSATMSAGSGTGCGTGTATNGTPINFTITVAGTCTVTVTGSLNAFQIEAGAFGTSLIVTAGATATRASDNVAAAGALLSAVQNAQGTILFKANMLNIPTNVHAPLLSSLTVTTFGMDGFDADSGSNKAESFLRNTTNLCVALNGFTAGINQKIIGSWKQSNYGLSLNGASVVTSTAANTLVFGAAYNIGRDATNSAWLNGYIAEIAVWNTQLPNGNLPALSTLP